MSQALPSKCAEFEEPPISLLKDSVLYQLDTIKPCLANIGCLDEAQSRNSCIICANSITSGVSTSLISSFALLVRHFRKGEILCNSTVCYVSHYFISCPQQGHTSTVTIGRSVIAFSFTHTTLATALPFAPSRSPASSTSFFLS